MNELFSERLRRLRKAKGHTQRSFAAQLGISNVAVSHWEGGMAQPSADRLKSVARVLGTSVDYLLSGNEDARYAALVAAIRRTTTDPRVLALVGGR